MTGPNDQAKQEHDDYWQAVTDVAEAVVTELEDTDTEEDRDETADPAGPRSHRPARLRDPR